jgi:transcriptional regulator with XRE-family HTH domain
VTEHRGMAQEVLAGLAGVSQGYLSKVETGAKEIERRSTLVAIAKALQVSVADLMTCDDPTDPLLVEANAAVPALEAAIIELLLGERRRPSGDVEQALAAVDRVAALRRDGRVAALAPVLPALLLDLASHDRPELIEMNWPNQNAHWRSDRASCQRQTRRRIAVARTGWRPAARSPSLAVMTGRR